MPEPLFVFELANNHMGDVEHGLRIIEKIAAASNASTSTSPSSCNIAISTHSSIPISSIGLTSKILSGFPKTRLDRAQTRRLVDAIKGHGFLTMCTPFDEVSVDRIVEEGFDILKIASCSFTDWPLLEKIVQTKLPIIGSTAGIELPDLDNVVSFIRHRHKSFALMACVAQYPTLQANLQINQIDVLKARYEDLRIGYSTHEDPSETLPVAIAVAKGASIFEKHVGVPTDAYPINAYSANPRQVRAWLEAARQAFSICGIAGQRIEPSRAELDALVSLRRGVFARKPIKAGERSALRGRVLRNSDASGFDHRQ